MKIQYELKAPKGQFNSFGKYKYRSCEDVLESLKPLLHKHGCVLLLTDESELVGDRYYIVARAMLVDVETGEKVEVSARARESAEKKGMDDSQITGTASSYARKYALNGLFCIDDTKDADSMDNSTDKKETTLIDSSKVKAMYAIAQGKNDVAKVVLEKNGYKSSTQVTIADYKNICDEIREAVK
jgi:hypothetical protein